MTNATGDPTKAMGDLGLAANLAASKHISLTDASTQLAAIMAGKGSKTLQQYGISMQTNADGTKNVQGALDALSAKVNGDASASVNNFSGKVDIVKTKLGDWAESMGQKVGPALTAVGPIMAASGAVIESGLVPKLLKGAASFLGFGSAAAESAVAVETAGVATEAAEEEVAATSETTGVATSLAFGPIGLAIGAIVIAITLLSGHWTEIWGGIKAVAMDIVGFFEQWGPLILTAVLPVIGLPLLIWQHWDAIIGMLKGVWNTVYGDVKGFVGNIVSTIAGLPGKILGLVGSMTSAGSNLIGGLWSGITNGFVTAATGAAGLAKSIFNDLIGYVDSHMIDPLKGLKFTIGAFGVSHTFQPFGSLPDIPKMAKGGTVTGPTLALIGEAGPEAVVPLSKSFGSIPGMGSGGDTYNVDFAGASFSGTPEQNAQAIVAALQRLKARIGPLGLS